MNATQTIEARRNAGGISDRQAARVLAILSDVRTAVAAYIAILDECIVRTWTFDIGGRSYTWYASNGVIYDDASGCMTESSVGRMSGLTIEEARRVVWCAASIEAGVSDRCRCFDAPDATCESCGEARGDDDARLCLPCLEEHAPECIAAYRATGIGCRGAGTLIDGSSMAGSCAFHPFSCGHEEDICALCAGYFDN